jgi:AraC-like DNA-binding protein
VLLVQVLGVKPLEYWSDCIFGARRCCETATAIAPYQTEKGRLPMSNCWAEAALRIIVANYANPQFNVNHLAEMLGKSTSFLREVVYTAYGMGVHELIETVRLEQAIKLLSANGDIIDLIRVKTGYAYAKTFRTAFKRRLNLTPRECKDMLARAENNLQTERLLEALWENANKKCH